MKDFDKMILCLCYIHPNSRITTIHKMLLPYESNNYKRKLYHYLKVYRAIKRLMQKQLILNHRGYLRVSRTGMLLSSIILTIWILEHLVSENDN